VVYHQKNQHACPSGGFSVSTRSVFVHLVYGSRNPSSFISRGVKRGPTTINLSSTTILFSPCQRNKVRRLAITATATQHPLLDFSTIFNTSSFLLGKQRPSSIVHPCFTPVKSDRQGHLPARSGCDNTSSTSSSSSSQFLFVSPLEGDDYSHYNNPIPNDGFRVGNNIAQPQQK